MYHIPEGEADEGADYVVPLNPAKHVPKFDFDSYDGPTHSGPKGVQSKGVQSEGVQSEGVQSEGMQSEGVQSGEAQAKPKQASPLKLKKKWMNKISEGLKPRNLFTPSSSSGTNPHHLNLPSDKQDHERDPVSETKSEVDQTPIGQSTDTPHRDPSSAQMRIIRSTPLHEEPADQDEILPPSVEKTDPNAPRYPRR